MLKSSPKIWHVNKRELSENNFLANEQSIQSSGIDVDFKSVWAHLPYCLWKHPLKQEFLDIYLTTISESVTLKIQNLSLSSFFSKWLKFNLNFRNAVKNWERIFSFCDNCIWICIVKLSLFRTGYFSSAAKVLTSCPKILECQ